MDTLASDLLRFLPVVFGSYMVSFINSLSFFCSIFFVKLAGPHTQNKNINVVSLKASIFLFKQLSGQ